MTRRPKRPRRTPTKATEPLPDPTILLAEPPDLPPKDVLRKTLKAATDLARQQLTDGR